MLPSPPVTLAAAVTAVVVGVAGGTLGPGAAPAPGDTPVPADDPAATAEAPVERPPATVTRTTTGDDDAATVPIECGGYDADGTLVNPAAARIDTAPVTPDGVVEIPPVCGGYSADGVFVGDD